MERSPDTEKLGDKSQIKVNVNKCKVAHNRGFGVVTVLQKYSKQYLLIRKKRLEIVGKE